MVLTRSEGNRHLALGFDKGSIKIMESVPATTTTSIITMTAPIESVASGPAATTTAVVMTPAVQQCRSRAGENCLPDTSYDANTSVPTLEYSSITARNEVPQSVRIMSVRQPSPSEKAHPNGDIVGELRDQFSRQMDEFRRSLQEIARAVRRQVGQATGDYGASAPARIPVQPMTEANYTNGAPGNNSFFQHFRPVRAPQFAQNFGSNSSPFNFPPDCPSSASNRVDLSKWGLIFNGTSKSMSAEEFMFRLDVLRQDYNCFFNDVLRSFHLLLEDQALGWYWNVRKLTTLRTWQDLETAFLT